MYKAVFLDLRSGGAEAEEVEAPLFDGESFLPRLGPEAM